MKLEPETSTSVSIKAITTTSTTSSSSTRGWSNIITARGWSYNIIRTRGWSNIIIIIMGQQNEAGVSTTFCGTLTVPRDLPWNHKIP
jgi:hypothetical protein